jgi:hypothetical protein
MTSAIKTAATRVLTDSELDTVAGGAASTCPRYDAACGTIFGNPPPPPPPPTK